MFTPNFSIDNLYSHKYLIEGRIASLPVNKQGTEVAIVGAGISGLIAAYELKKYGVSPIIYEATNRIGGRLYSKQFSFSDSDKPIFAELGAMRIPKCSELFYYYIDKFKIKVGDIFPEPGLVDTAIALGENKLFWPAKTPMPDKIIAKAWTAFIFPILNSIHKKWQQGKLTEASLIWKDLQDKYKNKSFYQVLAENTLLSKKTEFMTAFGVFGFGIGGFQSLFESSFVEILRILLNAYQVNEFSIADSLEALPQKLCTEVFGNNYGGVNDHLKLNCPVTEINYNHKTKNPILIYRDLRENTQLAIEYQAIIFTGTAFCAQLVGLTTSTTQGYSMLSQNVQQALKQQNLMGASKLYFCSKEKFWKTRKFPQCILSDGISKATYFLDYSHTNHGVICMSYTWGTDSEKLACFDAGEAYFFLKKNLQFIVPNLVKKLLPINNEIININWQHEKYYYGAFKFNPPGQLENEMILYHQVASVFSKHDMGLYLAGDGIGWSGGWVETAIYTAINATCAVIKRLGGSIEDEDMWENHIKS